MRSIAERWIGVKWVALLFVLLPARASAHPEFAETVVNRYVKVTLLSSSELRLAYTWMLGSSPALAARREADANGDGKLDSAETAGLGARFARRVEEGLALEIDGQKIVPRFEAPFVGLAGAEVAPTPFSVDLIARIPLAGAPPHTVRLDDRIDAPDLGETEVRIEESPGTRLVEAHRGAPVATEPAARPERETRFLFQGPRRSAVEDRSLTLRFDGGGQPPSREPQPSPRAGGLRGRALFGALAGALAVLLALGLWRYRRTNG